MNRQRAHILTLILRDETLVTGRGPDRVSKEKSRRRGAETKRKADAKNENELPLWQQYER